MLGGRAPSSPPTGSVTVRKMVDWAEMEVKKPDCAETSTRNIDKGTDATVKLTDGWKAWCRKIIALDGCFLKSPNQCEILTAIEKLLEQDLGSRRGNGLTLMSDQHKGLIEAVKDSMPNAEHRKCARHIYENFRKQYLGLEFKQLFLAASKAPYPQLFNKIMDKIKSANPNAHKYLIDKNSKTWSRAFFEVNRGCEAIENGFSE
ncbi:multidrug resistance-associated protein 5 [Tanacetum coccineum]|uniref:Multidrug resistance-associated protein 5 n=1 Tax=Tanacetum coccineum TaxID=301880 RepID=A0ABQ5C9G3_9ASTR